VAAYYFAPEPLAVIPLSLILLLVLTHLDFYRYTAKKRNFSFAFAIVPMQVVFFLGCVLSAVLGFVQYFFTPGKQPFRTRTLPLIVLIIVSLLAYVNAWPDRLIWDDGVFATGDRLLGVSFTDIQHYFTDDVWAAVGAKTGLYRPLFLTSVALDIQLFGDWVAGFHLVNIFLHMLVTLVVYGLIRYLLLECGGEPQKSTYIALLAALVFAVHPVHTEVVNSIFNRSEMLVSLGVVGGLWWFLPTVKNHPWKAWSLLGLIYLLVMFCRETGIMLPAITVVFLWVVTEGSWRLRLLKCLPVFWLLIPLAIYLAMRTHALDTPVAVAELAADTPIRADNGRGVANLGLQINFGVAFHAAAVWFDALKLMLWPDPLSTFYGPSETNRWVALTSHLALLGFAFIRLMQKKPGLILGLAFFYLSFLPSSRIVAESAGGSNLAERYIYMPSVGTAIVLAFGLGWLAQRFTLKTAAVLILVVLILLTPLTWARNALWTSNIRLAQADYNSSGQSERVLPILVKSILSKGDIARAGALCDRHSAALLKGGSLAENCAQVYFKLRRFESAEQAYVSAINDGPTKASAHYGLGVMYVSLNRKVEAAAQFEQAIATERNTFMREYLSAEMLTRLYPTDRIRLLEAKSHLETALQLQPQFYYARKKLDKLNRLLDPADREQHVR
jgi:tetratricopeptide (TPR) repeat protein